MKVAKSSANLLPVTTFLLATIPLSVGFPTSALAYTTDAGFAFESPVVRHENSGDMDMRDMDEGDALDSIGGDTYAQDTSDGSSSAIAPATPSIDLPTPTELISSNSHVEKPPELHGHSHGAHAPALEVLNDTDIHRWHHFPPTYLDADFRIDESSAIFGEELNETWNLEEVEHHQGLVLTHVVLFALAYAGLLPISLGLKAADHSAHYLVNLIFLSVAILSWLAGAAYKAAMPDYYEGSVYPTFVNILLFVSTAFTLYDSFELIKRTILFYNEDDRSWRRFVSQVLRSPRSSTDDQCPTAKYEMVGLVENESDEDTRRGRLLSESHVVFAIGDEEDEDQRVAEPESMSDEELPGFNEHEIALSHIKGTKPRRPSLLIRQSSSHSRTSTGSDGTLRDSPSLSSPHAFPHKGSHIGHYDAHPPRLSDRLPRESHMDMEEHQDDYVYQNSRSKGTLRAVGVVLTWMRRALVIFAYVTLIAGFSTYTGMCRAGLINSCAAHYIKGSIFFWYGVLTFGRYLGAYADLGWAWNKRPRGNSISAEMVECAVIFTYGITNTWMERFGSAPDSPYTVKQVQHISIAVMFWFAGLSGMLLESRWVKKTLGSVMSGGNSKEPESYASSFNPFPALTIGVTGLAMAAHHQTYVFQVQIHSLWGTLLAGGSLFRCLTYIMLYISPPVHSYLPSRPPTEILTAFGWAAGGILFMLSNEEIAWSAMRAGWDDMMAFLNVTIALTCLVFFWTAVVMAVKGWAVLRIRGQRQSAVAV